RRGCEDYGEVPERSEEAGGKIRATREGVEANRGLFSKSKTCAAAQVLALVAPTAHRRRVAIATLFAILRLASAIPWRLSQHRGAPCPPASGPPPDSAAWPCGLRAGHLRSACGASPGSPASSIASANRPSISGSPGRFRRVRHSCHR